MRTTTARKLLLVPVLLVSAYMAFWLCLMLGGFAFYLVVATVPVVAALVGVEIGPGPCTACGGRRVLEFGGERKRCEMCAGTGINRWQH